MGKLKEAGRDLHALIKRTANVSLILGAVLVSVSVIVASKPYVFVTFLVGHLIWAYSGYLSRNRELLWLNLSLVPIDIYAMIVRF